MMVMGCAQQEWWQVQHVVVMQIVGWGLESLLEESRSILELNLMENSWLIMLIM